jgi:glycosyltransferase involved in cell wall biosynthesis
MVKVSVIMCAFNAAGTIQESIESVLKQTLTDFELIVINDGSTDITKNIIKGIKDQRIVMIEQENQGPSIARNNGIKISRGDFIAILDSDDIAYPARLERQYLFLNENPDYVLIGSNAEVVDKDHNYIYTSDLPLSWAEINKKFPDAPFYHSSVMYRKSTYLACGGYHTLSKLYIFEDAILLNKMKESGKMANIKDPLIKYRLMPNAASTKSGREASFVNKICREIIAENNFSEKNQMLLDEVKRKSDPIERLRLYYLHIAKKHLWNNHQPDKARRNILKAIRIKPFRIIPVGLFLLSLIPKNVLFKIYHLNKS